MIFSTINEASPLVANTIRLFSQLFSSKSKGALKKLLAVGLLTGMLANTTSVSYAQTPTSKTLTRQQVVQEISGTLKIQAPRFTSPTKKATWKFTVETLCKTQDWTTKKLFSTCQTYALQNKFLDKKVVSTKRITRTELSNLLTRAGTLTTAPAKVSSPKPPAVASQDPEATIPEPTLSKQLSFTPITKGTISGSFFTNILLSEAIPNHFYQNEVFTIQGEVVGASASEVFVFLCKEEVGCDDNSEKFTAKTNGNRFKIPVYFKQSGNYSIGIIPGKSGVSRIETISVVPETPTVAGGGQSPTDLSLDYKDGHTTFSWNGSGTFTRLVIFQKNSRRDYIFRQKVNSFTPSSEDFNNFTKGQASWFVQHDDTSSSQRPIVLTSQDFYKVEDDEISVISLPEKLSSPSKFVFRGRATSKLSPKAYITLPNGTVESVTFASADLAVGTEFTVEKNFNSTGTYIFEINNLQGSAALNVPVYVGNEVPLIPDFFALNKGKLIRTASNLTEDRNAILNLINRDRRSMGLNPVVIWEDLNQVAQGHSQDMINRNYFGHNDPDGKGPEQRRKDAGIPVAVKENLGKGANLDIVQAGLMRSPVHRAVLVDPKLERVGIGVAKDSAGYYYVTQNFSTSPVSASNLSTIADSFYRAANETRSARGLSGLTKAATLEESASDWSSRMARDHFFNSVDTQGQTLVSLLRNRGVDSALEVYFLQSSDTEKIREELIKQDGLSASGNQKIGIGLGLGSLGEIYVTIIYTP